MRKPWIPALLLMACSSSAPDSDGGTSTTSVGTSTGDAAISGSTTTGGSGGVAMTSSTGARTTGATTEADGSGDPVFDVAIGSDLAAVDERCPASMYAADDDNLCAGLPVAYERDEGLLTLTVAKGSLFEVTDPNLEVVFATEQVGYEGFFTVVREMSAPDVLYMIIVDDDFMQMSLEGQCGLTLLECESDCIPGPGGDVCRAFVDDFIPIVANTYIGSPYTLDTFGRRRSPNAECCDEEITCNSAATTYTEYAVTGPGGSMHFIFEDGFAFLDTMGWSYEPRKQVSGDALFEFDLCSLPLPRG